MNFSYSELQQLTGGHWLVKPDSGNPKDKSSAKVNEVTGIQDDSRKVEPGDLFIAVPGELTDGHNYLKSAVQKGAKCLCIAGQRLDENRQLFLQAQSIPVLVVADTLQAFHAIARGHRRFCNDCTVIAVTGSSGKTSVKQMLAAVMETAAPGQVLTSLGNTNNQFGVPRNLLRLAPDTHRFAIIEAGTNHPGEIAKLAEMIEPDVAVVTNIGKAHLEAFETVEEVAREKGDLLTALPLDGKAVIPSRGTGIDILRNRVANRCLTTFGADADADVSANCLGPANDCWQTELSWHRKNEKRHLSWNCPGQHQALNAAAAAAVAETLNIPPATVIKGLEKTEMPDMRMEVLRYCGVTWVNDAYNANPDSMRAGLKAFGELTNNSGAKKDENVKRHLVLGDMHELGQNSAEEHRELLRWVRENFPDAEVLTLGEEIKSAAAEEKMKHVESLDAAADKLKQCLKPGDTVFLKASRRLNLEKLLAYEYCSSDNG